MSLVPVTTHCAACGRECVAQCFRCRDETPAPYLACADAKVAALAEDLTALRAERDRLREALERVEVRIRPGRSDYETRIAHSIVLDALTATQGSHDDG